MSSSSLLLISFFIHVVLLIAVYYLFQQMQTLKKDNAKELTDLFETYLREIRSENRRLESEIGSEPLQPKPIKVHKENIPDITKEVDISNIAEIDDSVLKTDTIDDTFETSLEAQILQLYHQGLEVTEIAQKLNCGKTEAALIINLYNKKKS